MKPSTASPLTVVVLNDYCHINGGASRIAVDEAVSLADAGLNVIFFGATGPICPELHNANLQVICLEQKELIDAGKNPFVMLQGLWNLQAYNRMNRLLDTLDKAFTVIHLHGYTKSLTTSVVRACVKRGFKVVCTLHDFFTACPNGAFFNYQQSCVCPLTAMSPACIKTHCDKRAYAHKLYRVGRSAVQKTIGMLPRGVKHYITLSNRSAEILKPYLPENSHYYALENLIEVPQAPPVNVASNQSVMAVGRLDVEKGIEVLLEATKRTGISLTLVGDGPLRAQAESVENCRVTGWLSPEGVAAELNNARCLVFPSIWYEAYGLVVSEAAARGVPAIVSDVSAAAERVTDGVHGWVVKTGDASDLARALLLTQDPALISTAGHAAYKRFWDNPPTRSNHTTGLLDIYKAILAA